MHPVMTMKNWNHHLHDGMLTMWHNIGQHLHSHYFWSGMAVTLLILSIATLLILLTKDVSMETYRSIPYGNPYAPF